MAGSGAPLQVPAVSVKRLPTCGDPTNVASVTSAGRVVVRTVMLRETGLAGKYSRLPPCDAVMVHAPAAFNVTSVPFEVQIVAGVAE